MALRLKPPVQLALSLAGPEALAGCFSILKHKEQNAQKTEIFSQSANLSTRV
jgi:hypothetical protein